MHELYILPCSKSKIWDNNPYIDKLQPSGVVYQGQLHLKGKSFIQRYQKSEPAYLILSAKYGFIYPFNLIENYNETFKSKKPDFEFLTKQIKEYKLTPDIVIVLGGSVYANVVDRVFKNSKICVPLQFMPIGMMLQALNNPISVKKVIDNFIWNMFPEDMHPLTTNLVDGCKRIAALPNLEKQESRG